jgi:hypothetical protein
MDDEQNDLNEQTVEQSFLIDQATSGSFHCKDQNVSSPSADETLESMENSSTITTECERNGGNQQLIFVSAVTNTVNTDCEYLMFSTQLSMP